MSATKRLDAAMRAVQIEIEHPRAHGMSSDTMRKVSEIGGLLQQGAVALDLGRAIAPALAYHLGMLAQAGEQYGYGTLDQMLDIVRAAYDLGAEKEAVMHGTPPTDTRQ